MSDLRMIDMKFEIKNLSNRTSAGTIILIKSEHRIAKNGYRTKTLP
jgi:hypothetical protein